MDPAAFAEMITEPSVTTVSVHTPYEGELPATDLFVVFDRVREERDRLPADRSATVAVSCRSGRMSSDAARTLAELGTRTSWTSRVGWTRARPAAVAWNGRGGG
ncbi:hypothetical protein KMZ32_03765 [Phycicoccus sp. MAQZ13P-2]|uniref:rhodanese-like domain-containing protein n=1 Tax=Phycicoccus mangrovi TaxID=2840470 RepID=UPI001C008CF1|nr:rhodanese-like domain-containing protein [Phycicoccus mangrovi]MBT9254606.1 hypothetical protein [Phycicoccus mangrovi]MBT9273189.1 hypothetical protein [Phycicoccus mangrovi]